MTLFRGMRPDPSDALPLVEDSAGGLGVRQKLEDKGDVPVVDGRVQPGTGGMSVSVDPMALPGFRRPRAFGGTNDKYRIYAIPEEVLPGPLTIRQDAPIDRPSHRCIEPVQTMLFEDYRDAIRSTRPSWRLYETD